jgi:uncharacterized protein (TIGR00255 family)
MILSMTGFGSGTAATEGFRVSVEAKTVNHRYLDVHIRLPSEYQYLESVVRRVIGARIHRGRVDVFVRIDRVRAAVELEADPDLIAAYVALVEDLHRKFSIEGGLTLDTLSHIPGAIRVVDTAASPEARAELEREVEKALSETLDRLLEMRVREGEALAGDLRSRLDSIRTSLGVIGKSATALVQHYRKVIVQRIAELAPDLPVDSSRLEVEALIHAEKSDIAEEVTRLGSHIDQFSDALGKSGEAGKRLDFLLQEMNREVSTILSKTSGLNQSDGALGQAGIDIKVEIDKLREQVQNIE